MDPSIESKLLSFFRTSSLIEKRNLFDKYENMKYESKMFRKDKIPS